MKTKSVYLILILALATSGLFAQTKTVRTNIKVYGNCAMCKERIESALERPGIKFARWNTASKSLEVVFNNRKVSEKEIHEIIAATGHDTEEVKAKDEVYAKLPFCCLYRDYDHSNIIDEPHKH